MIEPILVHPRRILSTMQPKAIVGPLDRTVPATFKRVNFRFLAGRFELPQHGHND